MQKTVFSRDRPSHRSTIVARRLRPPELLRELTRAEHSADSITLGYLPPDDGSAIGTGNFVRAARATKRGSIRGFIMLSRVGMLAVFRVETAP